jgi:hypothetical protein
LENVGEVPARQTSNLDLPTEAGQVFFQDGTERPIQRPQDPEDQEKSYSGKKNRHTVKNTVLVNAQAKILLLTQTCEGKKHDKKIADETQLRLPTGSLLSQEVKS